MGMIFQTRSGRGIKKCCKIIFAMILQLSLIHIYEAEKTVKQIKKIPTVWSTITSSAIYDADSNHIFGMCGHVKDSEDKRRGMNYEFDYDTEELINQFSIKSYYYRASEMKIDRCV